VIGIGAACCCAAGASTTSVRVSTITETMRIIMSLLILPFAFARGEDSATMPVAGRIISFNRGIHPMGKENGS